MTDKGIERTRIVYFVSPSKHFAGIERVVHEIATGLMEQFGDRLDVHVLYSSAYDDPVLTGTMYRKHVLGVDRLRRMAVALRSRVRELDPDVLVCPQVEASVIAWFATRGLRLPLFVPHLHGNPRVEEADGTRRTRAAFVLFRHVVARRVPAVLAVSPSLGRYAQRTIARHTDVIFAPNPVRCLSGASEPRPTRGDGPFRFVTVARLTRQKGQDQLLRAAAQARPGLPSFRMTFVGSGDAEVELRALCTLLELDDVVEFAGSVPDPTPHLRDADCFVLPSRWEGFGLALVEALQFGLPVIATDCEFGPSDIITDRRIGELVSDADVAALADALVTASTTNDPPWHAEGRRLAATAYSRTEAARAHYSVLARIGASPGWPDDEVRYPHTSDGCPS